MSIETKLTELCEILTEKYHLHPNRVTFASSTNKSGEIVSNFIQIFECAYPTSSLTDGTVTPVLRMTSKKPTELFSTSKALADSLFSFCEQNNIEFKVVLDKKGVFQSVRFTFFEIGDLYFNFIEKCVDFVIRNYSSSADKFGCCSQYLECSNAKKCLHSNLLYATACEYRKHLEQGDIFYGENRNV